MKNLLSLIIFSSVFLYNCTDENPVSIPSIERGYFPLTQGSRWEYEIYTPNSNTGQDTAISIDSVLYIEVINKRKCSKIERLTTTDWNVYPSTNKGLYTRRNDTVFYYNDEVYLVERVNAMWSHGPSGDNVKSKFDYSVTGKGLKHSVNNILYNDVLRVHEIYTRTITSDTTSDTSIFETDIYYAKDIGLVERGIMKLKSYSIK
ncbi:MAG: hypothetical protein V4642_11520 [Bacteroidota bacterium]